MRTKLIIDSRDRTKQGGSGSSSGDFRIGLQQAINNIKAFKITKISIPFSWYPVNSSNNTIVFTESGVQKSAVITPKYYDSTTLPGAIGSAMTSAGTQTYTATYTAATGKFTITAAAAFAILGTQCTSKDIIGFSADTAAGTSQIGDSVANITGENTVYVHSNALGARTGNVAGCQQADVLYSVPVGDVPTGNVISVNDSTNTEMICDIKNLNTIDMSLKFYGGSSVDLNGKDWMIELVLDNHVY